MMRQPTERGVLLDWWRRAVSGEPVPIHADIAECGFFKRRMVKNGPWVAVEIFCHRVVNELGELLEPERLLAKYPWGDEVPALNIWTYLKPISSAEYIQIRRTNLADLSAVSKPIDITTNFARPA